MAKNSAAPIARKWRRVSPRDGEGCPGFCDESGFVYDCIDGCCVDPESGCDLCASRCDYCWERVAVPAAGGERADG